MSNKITTIEKLVDRIYTEDDFGQSVATSLSGLVGLLVYIFTNDWVTALFSTVITFPIIRIIFTKLDIKLTHKRQEETSKKRDLRNLLFKPLFHCSFFL